MLKILNNGFRGCIVIDKHDCGKCFNEPIMMTAGSMKNLTAANACMMRIYRSNMSNWNVDI